MIEDKDYYYDNGNLIVIDKSLEKAMKEELEQLKECLNSEKVLQDFNSKNLQDEYISLVGTEDINKWSFDSISFYPNQQHELDNINLDKYNISKFDELPKEPQFIEKSNRNRTWKQFELSRICGVVLDRRDNMHLVDILTNDNKVITVKFNGGQYAWYKQTINIDGIKDVNWLSRGTLLMISGYRKGEDNFVAKSYKNSLFQHSVVKILEITKDKELITQSERLQED